MLERMHYRHHGMTGAASWKPFASRLCVLHFLPFFALHVVNSRVQSCVLTLVLYNLSTCFDVTRLPLPSSSATAIPTINPCCTQDVKDDFRTEQRAWERSLLCAEQVSQLNIA